MINSTGRPTYLGEKSVETVDLLTLLDIGVVLGNTTKGKFIHEIDFIRIVHVLILRDLSVGSQFSKRADKL
jgi:hypothetical protein